MTNAIASQPTGGRMADALSAGPRFNLDPAPAGDPLDVRLIIPFTPWPSTLGELAGAQMAAGWSEITLAMPDSFVPDAGLDAIVQALFLCASGGSDPSDALPLPAGCAPLGAPTVADGVANPLYSVDAVSDGEGNNIVTISLAPPLRHRAAAQISLRLQGQAPGETTDKIAISLDHPPVAELGDSGWTDGPVDSCFELTPCAIGLSIASGTLESIKIVDDLGVEVADKTIASGATLDLCAAGYDANGFRLEDQDVSWILADASVSSPGQHIGTFDAPQGPCATFTASNVGDGLILANDGSGHLDATGRITVMPAGLDQIIVRDAPNGLGNEVGDFAMTADDTLRLFAAGYDAADNYLGDLPATWQASAGDLNPATPSSSVTYDARTAGTDLVTATVGVETDSTGTITITPGLLSSISIHDGTQSPVGGPLLVGETLAMHAGGYDADGNFRGDEAQAVWRVISSTPFCGDVNPITGPTTTFTALVATGAACQVEARVAPFTATSDPITVSTDLNAVVASIKILAGGEELGPTTLTTDEPLLVEAAGFDASGNYLGPQADAEWDVSDASKAAVDSHDDGTATLDPQHPGTIEVLVEAAGLEADGGPVAIRTGAFALLQIRDGPGGTGQEVDGLNLDADDEQRLYAAGYDADTNFVGDREDATWTVQGACGSLEDNFDQGPVAIFDATTVTEAAANCHVRAASLAIPDGTGAIAVDAGMAAFIEIHDANGPINDRNIVSTNFLEMFAIGKDADGNIRGPVETARWSVIGDCGTLSGTVGSSVWFDPVRLSVADDGCKVQIEDDIVAGTPAVRTDTTGNIIVQAGPPAHIKVRTAPNNGGIEAGPLAATTDDSPTFYAAAYDADFNYHGDVSVTWSLTPATGIATITTTNPDDSVTLDLHTPGNNLVITATLSTNIADSTGPIAVVVGELAEIRILDDLGAVVGAFTLNSQATKVLNAAGYDADGNYISDESSDWTVTQACGTVLEGPAESTTFTAGVRSIALCRVVATSVADDSVDDETGDITVVVPAPTQLKIRDAPGGVGNEITTLTLTADQTTQLYAAGYDAADQYVGDWAATWTADGLGAFDPATASASVTFDAGVTGTGTITASLSGATSGTATLTVNPGILHHFDWSGVTSPQTAGVSFSGTVTARDADGNKKTDYAGTVSFNVATDAQDQMPASYTFVPGAGGDDGDKEFTFELRTAGSHVIRVADGAIFADTSSITVDPAVAAVFDVVCSSGCPATAGQAFTLDITAEDAFGNTATSYDGDQSLTFSGAVAAPDGTGPECELAAMGALTVNFNDGVAGVECILYKAVSTTLSITEGSVADTITITVNAEAADSLIVTLPNEVFDAATGTNTGTASNPTAGVASTVQIRALDEFLNVATAYTGAKSFLFSGALDAFDGTDATAKDSAGTAQPFGTATSLNFAGGFASADVRLVRAGTGVALAATDGTFSDTAATINVIVAPAARVGILNCAPTTASARDCILASESVTAALQLSVGTVYKFHAAQFDEFDNLIALAFSVHWSSVGTSKATNPCGSIGTPSMECLYDQAGTDTVRAIRVPTPVVTPATLEVIVA